MGREATCHARMGRESGVGKALLETDEVRFRGDFRARVPLREISRVLATRGVLTLEWPGGRLALALGEAAEKWAEAIRHPKSVVEKLGVKPGLKVAVLAGFDADFRTYLEDFLSDEKTYVVRAFGNARDLFESCEESLARLLHPKGRHQLEVVSHQREV